MYGEPGEVEASHDEGTRGKGDAGKNRDDGEDVDVVEDVLYCLFRGEGGLD